MKLHFLRTYSKNTQTSNSTTIRPERAELFHAGKRRDVRTDGREDTKKLLTAFRNFANPPNYPELTLFQLHSAS